MRLICSLLFIVTALFSNDALQAEDNRFVLLLGPSGVGKSTIIHHLKELDSSFVYVTPYTTRELRPGESDKIHVDRESMMQMEEEGKLLTINEFHGIYYATPREIIDRALDEGKFPILDWPVEKMEIMLRNYGDKLFTVYVEPESLEELERRLSLDGRDKEGKRFAAGKIELENYYEGKYDALIDWKIVNKQGEDREAACSVYTQINLKSGSTQ